ncbi:hypothetical protein OROMI_020804 [Orobanche minor]
MEPKIYLLDAITPDTKNWTAKVYVLNKTEPRTSSQPASIRFQKMLFADKKGNKIEGMLYRGDIDLLKNSLQLYQTYLISNALVRPVKPGFENPLTNNKFQWILGARTAILATDEDSSSPLNLLPLSHNVLIISLGTAAILIDSHTPRTLTAKGKQNTLHEYAAVDELLKPFIITFWNDAAPDDVYNLLDRAKDRHIIAALNFNVTEYHNISLTSTSASVVLMNSKVECQGDVFKRAQSNFSIDLETFTPVQMFLTAEQIYPVHSREASFHKSELRLPMLHQISSSNNAEYGCLFECHSCHEIKNAIPRYRFSVLIYDETGKMEVSVFGDEGDKIMQMPAVDFLDKYSKARLLTIDSINSNLHQLELKMKVQSKFFNKQDGTSTLSHTMQSLECHQLPSSTISTNQLPSSTISTDDIPGASSAGKADMSELPQPDTGPLISPAKDYPRPDLHTTTSSRGRELKIKKVE